MESLGGVEQSELAVAKPETALVWGAKYLRQNFYHRAGRFLEGSGISAGVARLRTHAAAQSSGEAQHSALVSLLELVQKMVTLKQWRAVASLEHTKYDETPVLVRLKFAKTTTQAEKQVGKVFLH